MFIIYRKNFKNGKIYIGLFNLFMYIYYTYLWYNNNNKNVHNYGVRGEKKIKGEVREREKKDR